MDELHLLESFCVQTAFSGSCSGHIFKGEHEPWICSPSPYESILCKEDTSKLGERQAPSLRQHLWSEAETGPCLTQMEFLLARGGEVALVYLLGLFLFLLS